jgi:hypothetical protein
MAITTYQGIKTPETAIKYIVKFDYKQIALKDGQGNFILPYNSMNEGAFENKVQEIKFFLADHTQPNGTYFISGRKSPRSGQSIDLPVSKGYGTNVAQPQKSFYANFGGIPQTSGTDELTQLRLQNQLLEERIFQLEEGLDEEGEEDKDPLIALAEEHMPALMELGKMWLSSVMAKNEKTKTFTPIKKRYTLQEIAVMPQSDLKNALIEKLRTDNPVAFNKLHGK